MIGWRLIFPVSCLKKTTIAFLTLINSLNIIWLIWVLLIYNNFWPITRVEIRFFSIDQVARTFLNVFAFPDFNFKKFMTNYLLNVSMSPICSNTYYQLFSMVIKKMYMTFYWWCLTFNNNFSYIVHVAVSFIGGRKQRTRRKQLTCCKFLTNFII
jgi:hypothetical protein